MKKYINDKLMLIRIQKGKSLKCSESDFEIKRWWILHLSFKIADIDFIKSVRQSKQCMFEIYKKTKTENLLKDE